MGEHFGEEQSARKHERCAQPVDGGEGVVEVIDGQQQRHKLAQSDYKGDCQR